MPDQPRRLLATLFWPSLLTLAVSVARLTGEVQGYITAQSGGAFAMLGTTWLVFVFGAWFGIRLARDGSAPLRRPAWLWSLIPLLAIETLEPALLARLPGFRARLEWFLSHRPDLVENAAPVTRPGREGRFLLAVVTPDRLRFDFSHLIAMTKEEMLKVNAIVNEKIRQNLPVYDEELPYKKAIEQGVIALFDEKYGEVVRVLRIGRPPVSAELCGGTHITATGKIGFFRIVSESSIGSGLRRIEAMTGREAEKFIEGRFSDLQKAAEYHIDLGRKDMLQPGTIFQIKNPNEPSIKGYAKVTRVEQDRAEVMLYDLADKVGDPIRDGDQLYNDLYSPGANSKRKICLLGRFGYPYHKPQLEALLKNLGNTVVAKMEPGVDTVILGDDEVNESKDGMVPVQDSDDYKFANQLGVEFVPMRKIRDIVKPD